MGADRRVNEAPRCERPESHFRALLPPFPAGWSSVRLSMRVTRGEIGCVGRSNRLSDNAAPQFRQLSSSAGEKGQLGEHEAGDAERISPTLNLANTQIWVRKLATEGAADDPGPQPADRPERSVTAPVQDEAKGVPVPVSQTSGRLNHAACRVSARRTSAGVRWPCRSSSHSRL
jgi:hypothetical protein